MQSAFLKLEIGDCVWGSTEQHLFHQHMVIKKLFMREIGPQNAGWCPMWQSLISFSPHPRHFSQILMDLKCSKESWLYWALEHKRKFIVIISMLLLCMVCKTQAPDVKFYQHNVSLIKYYICNIINNVACFHNFIKKLPWF